MDPRTLIAAYDAAGVMVDVVTLEPDGKLSAPVSVPPGGTLWAARPVTTAGAGYTVTELDLPEP